MRKRVTEGNYNELKPSIYVSMKQEMNEDVWMKEQSALLSPTTLHLGWILGGEMKQHIILD